MKKYYFIGIFLFLTLASYMYHLREDINQSEDGVLKPQLKIDEQIAFDHLNGQRGPLKIKELKQNYKGILLHFWASWCAPCEQELKELTSALSFFSSSPVALVLVAVNDKREKALAMLEKYGLNGRNIFILSDDRNVHFDRFGVYKLPESFLFELKNENLLRKYTGPQPWGDETFLISINTLLRL